MTTAPCGAAPPGNLPHIGFGHVWHTRLRPRRHRFIVPTFFLLLPMRTLRERPEDVPVLVHHFLRKYAQLLRKNVFRVSPALMQRLVAAEAEERAGLQLRQALAE